VYQEISLTVDPILIGVAVRLGRYLLNIHWVYLEISLAVDPILIGVVVAWGKYLLDIH